MSRLLQDDELARQLAELPGVRQIDRPTLQLIVRAPTFQAAIDLVNLVAQDAEAMNHHPDIDIRWRTVTFALSTHSVGGITQLDIELAHQILESMARVGAQLAS